MSGAGQKFPALVMAETADGHEVEILGGAPCMWAGKHTEPKAEVEWVMPMNRLQLRGQSEMFVPALTAAEVALKGGGVVYAAITAAVMHVAGFGLWEKDGKAHAALKVHATFWRVRVIAAVAVPPGKSSAIPPTLVR